MGCEDQCVGKGHWCVRSGVCIRAQWGVCKRHRVERVPCMSHVSEQMSAFLCTQLGLTPGILTHT